MSKVEVIMYVIEVAIAAVLLWIDQRLFLLFFFLIVVWSFHGTTEHLKRHICVFNLLHTVRIQAIADHVGCSQENMEELLSEATTSLSPKQRDILEKAIRDVYGV